MQSRSSVETREPADEADLRSAFIFCWAAHPRSRTPWIPACRHASFVRHHRPGIDHPCCPPAPRADPSADVLRGTRDDLSALSDRHRVRVSQGWLCFRGRHLADSGLLLELLHSSAVLGVKGQEPAGHSVNRCFLSHRMGDYRHGYATPQAGGVEPLTAYRLD